LKKKATENINWDELETRLLKEQNEIVPIITIIVQKSLNTEPIPTIGKQHMHVVSIYRKGSKHNFGNYRSISLTYINFL
jgi:hypothetical protein